MILNSSNWLLLFPVAFTLLIGLRLAQGAVDSQRQSLIELILQSFISLSFLLCFLALGIRIGSIQSLWLIVVIVPLFILFWKNRKLGRLAIVQSALQTNTLTERQQLFGYFVAENRGWIRRRAARVRRDLALGRSWVDSIEGRGLAGSVYARIALRLRDRYGAADLASQPGDSATTLLLEPTEIESAAERLIGRFAIFSWVIFMGPLLLFIGTFIAPTLSTMLNEFGIQQPLLYERLFGGRWYFTGAPLVAMLAIGPLLFISSSLTLGLLWMFPAVLRVPGLRWLCMDYYRAAGYLTLGHAAAAEQDLPQALAATAEILPLPFLSQQYRVAHASVLQGVPPVEAMIASGIIPHGVGRDAAVQLSGRDLVWGLQQFAHSRVERMLRRYSSLSQLLVVMITLLLAALVGTLCVAIMHVLSIIILQSVN